MSAKKQSAGPAGLPESTLLRHLARLNFSSIFGVGSLRQESRCVLRRFVFSFSSRLTEKNQQITRHSRISTSLMIHLLVVLAVSCDHYSHAASIAVRARAARSQRGSSRTRTIQLAWSSWASTTSRRTPGRFLLFTFVFEQFPCIPLSLDESTECSCWTIQL